MQETHNKVSEIVKEHKGGKLAYHVALVGARARARTLPVPSPPGPGGPPGAMREKKQAHCLIHHHHHNAQAH